MKKKTIVVLAGTRPEVIKLAPVVQALRQQRALNPVVWLTGQHTAMAKQMLEHFQLRAEETFRISRKPGHITKLLAEVSRELAHHLAQSRPDMIVVQGDTTSAMLGAIAGFYESIPVAHVEAGLRSFDLRQPFPEEFNRRVISVGATLHFCPTKVSAANLLREGVDRQSIHVVGNTCIDALFWTLRRRKRRRIFSERRRGILVTLHRRENWGDAITGICRVLRDLASEFQDTEILLPVHKNPVVAETIRRELHAQDRISLLAPMDYASFCQAMKEAYFIVSDSGGVQEEALALGTPVLVTRSVTERPEVLKGGTVRLVGTSPQVLHRACAALLADKRAYAKAHVARFPFGRGNAARKIAATINRVLH